MAKQNDKPNDKPSDHVAGAPRRPPNPAIQALAKIDRLMASLNPQDALKIATWAMTVANERLYADQSPDKPLPPEVMP